MKTFVFLLCLMMMAAQPSSAGQTNDLETLREKYEQAQGKINREIFCLYSNNVAGLVSEFKKKGDFAACVLLTEEQKAMTTLPIVPTGETREALIQGISGYGEMINKLDAEKFQRLLKLQKLYVEKLDKLLKSLLTADKMEEAKQVNDEKARIEALVAASTPADAEETGTAAVVPEPPATAAKVNTEPEATAAKSPKALAKNLIIVKATITIKNGKSYDVTQEVQDAVQDNQLVYRDWARHHYGGSLLTIQYRFGNSLMKTIQGRNNAPVIISEKDNR